MSTDIHPILPPEIEQIIFSLAGKDDIKRCGNCILVAKRVYEWLKPELFKVAILHDKSRFNPTLLEKDGRHVRHILFWSVISEDPRLHEPATCLSWCPNVVNVALWNLHTDYDENLINALLNLPLTHLSLDIVLFHFHVQKSSISKPVMFTSVTHVYLVGSDLDFPHEVKEYLPALSHLALGESTSLPIRSILDTWKDQLRVLVLYTRRAIIFDDVPDRRLVFMRQSMDSVREWEEVAEDGEDNVWRLAEREVQRRGEMPGLNWNQIITRW